MPSGMGRQGAGVQGAAAEMGVKGWQDRVDSEGGCRVASWEGEGIAGGRVWSFSG